MFHWTPASRILRKDQAIFLSTNNLLRFYKSNWENPSRPDTHLLLCGPQKKDWSWAVFFRQEKGFAPALRRRGMSYPFTLIPRLVISIITTVVVISVFAAQSPITHAQTTDPLAQQWADDRVELERIAFLRRSWQISDSEFRDRTNKVNLEIRDLGAQIAKLAPARQAQIRQQSDSVFTVVVVPLREQWQQQTKDRDTKIRADIATDAKTAADLQASRTLLNEKLQHKEITQADFTNRDQAMQQQLVAMQNKWTSVDPNWGNFYTQSWQRLMPASLADLRKKESTANDDDVRAAVGLLVEIQHNAFLREKHVITDAEEQKRDAGPGAQADMIQAKYKGPAGKDFMTRVSSLVDSGVAARKPQWEQEARAAGAGTATPPPTAPPKLSRYDTPGSPASDCAASGCHNDSHTARHIEFGQGMDKGNARPQSCATRLSKQGSGKHLPAIGCLHLAAGLHLHDERHAGPVEPEPVGAGRTAAYPSIRR
jgi:hypothetical protein